MNGRSFLQCGGSNALRLKNSLSSFYGKGWKLICLCFEFDKHRVRFYIHMSYQYNFQISRLLRNLFYYKYSILWYRATGTLIYFQYGYNSLDDLFKKKKKENYIKLKKRITTSHKHIYSHRRKVNIFWKQWFLGLCNVNEGI